VINIYYSKISNNIPGILYQEYLTKLPPLLQAKNKKYLKWQDRLLHLFGQLLLLEALTEFQPGIVNPFDFLYYNTYGRPYVSELIDFNISHSGEYVVCAIGQHTRLGIDIEKIKPVAFTDFETVMTSDEWKIIKSSNNQTKFFFTYWVIKESVIKADSRGLSIPLRNIIIDTTHAQCSGELWYLHQLNIDSDYCTCLATDKKVENLHFKFIQF
jgi:4'-phosphopantetheinyl transferase